MLTIEKTFSNILDVEDLFHDDRDNNLGTTEPQVDKYFFGENSVIGQRVVVEIKAGRHKQKRSAIVIDDTTNNLTEMIVVQYSPGYKESFTKPDMLAGLVDFHLKHKLSYV